MIETTEIVRQFLFENYMVDDEDDLDNDDSFLEKGIIDSTGILELIMFLEETFDIEVEDEEVIPENLDSVNKIGKYINRKQAGLQVEAAA